MNFGREYRYEWHDLMVELEGPVVSSFEDRFRLDWAHAGLWGDLAYTAALVDHPVHSEIPPGETYGATMRRLPTTTTSKPFATAVLGSIQRARSYVYVENPYLFDRRVIAALVRARLRGVDVRVVLPRVNDCEMRKQSNVAVANYLLQQGVRVFFYPGMTRVKALLVDDWACLRPDHIPFPRRTTLKSGPMGNWLAQLLLANARLKALINRDRIRRGDEQIFAKARWTLQPDDHKVTKRASPGPVGSKPVAQHCSYALVVTLFVLIHVPPLVAVADKAVQGLWPACDWPATPLG